MTWWESFKVANTLLEFVFVPFAMYYAATKFPRTALVYVALMAFGTVVAKLAGGRH